MKAKDPFFARSSIQILHGRKCEGLQEFVIVIFASCGRIFEHWTFARVTSKLLLVCRREINCGRTNEIWSLRELLTDERQYRLPIPPEPHLSKLEWRWAKLADNGLLDHHPWNDFIGKN
jgi:hypothetical protein